MKRFSFAPAFILALAMFVVPASAQTAPANASSSSASTPVYAAPPAAAPQSPAPQPAPPSPPVALTDARQIKDADFIHDQLLAFSNYMGSCMANQRGYKLMADCLCEDRTDFMHLYTGMDGILNKYPAWQGKTVSYKMPGDDAPTGFDLGLWANRLTRFHANLCKGN